MQRISPQNRQQRVELGRFGKVVGIKGWLRVISFTSPAENIGNYSLFESEISDRWVQLELDQIRTQGKSLVAHVLGYDDPETSRELTGKGIWVASSALPDLEHGEYYWHQLEGLPVVDQHGNVYGVVAELMETGANDVLVVTPTADSMDDRQRLIPYLTGTVVQAVNLEAGRIEVNWEPDYLE